MNGSTVNDGIAQCLTSFVPRQQLQNGSFDNTFSNAIINSPLHPATATRTSSSVQSQLLAAIAAQASQQQPLPVSQAATANKRALLALLLNHSKQVTNPIVADKHPLINPAYRGFAVIAAMAARTGLEPSFLAQLLAQEVDRSSDTEEPEVVSILPPLRRLPSTWSKLAPLTPPSSGNSPSSCLVEQQWVPSSENESSNSSSGGSDASCSPLAAVDLNDMQLDESDWQILMEDFKSGSSDENDDIVLTPTFDLPDSSGGLSASPGVKLSPHPQYSSPLTNLGVSHPALTGATPSMASESDLLRALLAGSCANKSLTGQSAPPTVALDGTARALQTQSVASALLSSLDCPPGQAPTGHVPHITSQSLSDFSPNAAGHQGGVSSIPHTCCPADVASMSLKQPDTIAVLLQLARASEAQRLGIASQNMAAAQLLCNTTHTTAAAGMPGLSTTTGSLQAAASTDLPGSPTLMTGMDAHKAITAALARVLARSSASPPPPPSTTSTPKQSANAATPTPRKAPATTPTSASSKHSSPVSHVSIDSSPIVSSSLASSSGSECDQEASANVGGVSSTTSSATSSRRRSLALKTPTPARLRKERQRSNELEAATLRRENAALRREEKRLRDKLERARQAIIRRMAMEKSVDCKLDSLLACT